ncbi:hypothetical protein M427DRAFT_437481 [Gonapodya prolifera JEL478]|uniref:SH2 domain-containing protein n=1 Tax=Gonapodya prolifera (strain JEL478) TaxID=1344416 RepID=A0A139A3R3_GONPJ|nr:hypothetical protein M427DRAFT_437481 [Gonapodya prolifera JEL478]|eukprot:KXS11457.1 hypothetical protein M427DRAFT_437481 [Gonapodya prolifera JEL478]
MDTPASSMDVDRPASQATSPGRVRPPKDPEKKKKRKRDMNSDDDEGEDTARPSSKNPHLFSDDEDSEDEEEDDPDKAMEEFKGFIVDEPDSGEDEPKTKKDESDDDQSDVEEEDLDLIRENLGQKTRRVKRLRRNRVDDDDDDAAPSSSTPARAARDDDDAISDDGLAQMFEGSSKPAEPIEYYLASDEESMDGFIEDDEPGGEEMDEADKRAMRQERARQRKRAQARENGGASEEWMEMFDASEYAVVEAEARAGDAGQPHARAGGRATRLDDDEDEDGEGGVKKVTKLEDVWEPTVIAEKLLTEDDEIIRTTDIPERYQLRHTRGSYKTCKIPTEFHREGVYISHMMAHALNKASYTDPPQQAAIIKVLQFMRDEDGNLLEVPFIATLRKDHWHPHLTQEDLWLIAELDEEFQMLDTQLQALMPLVEQARKWSFDARDDPVIEQIESKVDSAIAAEDVRRYVRLHYGEEIARGEEEAAKDKTGLSPAASRAEKKPHSRYQNLKEAGMLVASRGFHVNRRTFLSGVVDAFMNSQNVKRHFPEEEGEMPLDYFERFTRQRSRFSRAEVVMASARTVIAEEIATEPELRGGFRRRFANDAVVNVEPTDKGKGVITEMNPYYSFKYLRYKPVSQFTDGQFACIVKAEEEGLLKVTVRLDPKVEEALLASMRFHIQSDGASDLAAAWNLQRHKIVEEALELIKRDTVKWMRQKMIGEATLYIAKEATKNLEKKLMRAPLEPKSSRSDDDDDDDDRDHHIGLNLLVVSWGAGDKIKDPATVVTVNPDGLLKGVFKMYHLQDRKIDGEDSKEKRDELLNFQDLIGRTKADAIVVTGETPKTRVLYDEVKKAVDAASQMWRHRRAPVVVYGMDDVARIWRSSRDAMREFPEHADIVRYCVAVGRMVQDPLMAYASLADLEGSITRVRFHSQQSAVPKDMLVNHFQRAFMNATAVVGVDINQAIRFGHQAHTLQFVCGFGPRKAMGLQMKAKSLTGQRIISRGQLVVDQESGVRILGARVFYNCGSFIRIRGHEFTRNVAVDPLDDTRIHLEDYDLARKMAADAMDADDLDEEDENPSRHVEELMDGNQKRLDDLLLDDYADELEKRIGEPKRLLLLDMKKELQDPYGERRKPFFDNSPEIPKPEDKPTYEDEVFTMLTGEDDETWSVGTVAPATVVRMFPPRDEGQSGLAIIAFRNGLEAKVSPRDRYGPNVPLDMKIDAILKVDQPIMARLRAFDKRTLQVEVGIRENEEQQPVRDRYFDLDRERADKDKKQRDIMKAAAEGARPELSHPYYHRDWGIQESEDYLSGQEIGTIVVRPSSTPGNLVAVIKFDRESYWHIGIQHSFSQTGREQWTVKDTSQTFESLDHLINIFIEPMVGKIRELRAHSKFMKNMRRETVEKELMNQLIRQPNRSAYAFCSADAPGFFYLVYRFAVQSPAEHERVYLDPGKFKFRERQYATVDDLLRFFKMNPKRPQAQGGAPPGRQNMPMSQYGGQRPGTAYGGAPAMRAGIQGYQTPGGVPYGMGGYGAPTPMAPVGFGYGGGATPAYGVAGGAGAATLGYNGGYQQPVRR